MDASCFHHLRLLPSPVRLLPVFFALRCRAPPPLSRTLRCHTAGLEVAMESIGEPSPFETGPVGEEGVLLQRVFRIGGRCLLGTKEAL